MVNSHGDCKSPKDRLVRLINGGGILTAYIRPGMVRQVRIKTCGEGILGCPRQLGSVGCKLQPQHIPCFK